MQRRSRARLGRVDHGDELAIPDAQDHMGRHQGPEQGLVAVESGRVVERRIIPHADRQLVEGIRRAAGRDLDGAGDRMLLADDRAARLATGQGSYRGWR